MYKVFEVTYNDGGWHSGPLPHFFYIAKSKEEVVSQSKKYKEFIERQQQFGGDIWICEVSGIVDTFYFENLDDFVITAFVQKK